MYSEPFSGIRPFLSDHDACLLGYFFLVGVGPRPEKPSSRGLRCFGWRHSSRCVGELLRLTKPISITELFCLGDSSPMMVWTAIAHRRARRHWRSTPSRRANSRIEFLCSGEPNAKIELFLLVDYDALVDSNPYALWESSFVLQSQYAQQSSFVWMGRACRDAAFLSEHHRIEHSLLVDNDAFWISVGLLGEHILADLALFDKTLIEPSAPSAPKDCA